MIVFAIDSLYRHDRAAVRQDLIEQRDGMGFYSRFIPFIRLIIVLTSKPTCYNRSRQNNS